MHEQKVAQQETQERCVVIPRNFDNLSEKQRRDIVPICVPRHLPDGREIPYGWFSQGVGPASQSLRSIAKNQLKDVWRVSELAERVVFALGSQHGEELGSDPKRRIIVRAIWEVKNMIAGGRSERWYRFQTKQVTTLHYAMSLSDEPSEAESFANRWYREILLETVYERLGRDATIQRAFGLMAAGCSWDEVESEMGNVEIALSIESTFPSESNSSIAKSTS